MKRRGTARARTALAISHVEFEDLGILAPLLRARGLSVRYRTAGLHELSRLDPLAPDLLVILGGPIGAYEENRYPFLRDELSLIGRRLEAEKPTLGICLGAQLMARVLGARVYPGPRKEIGWAPLSLTAEGRRSCLAPLAGVPVLHWHGDTFDLPKGAVRLASTDVCANQAFSMGPRTLGLQFHAEPRARALERWLVGHACELAGAGLNPEDLRADTRRFGKDLERQGAAAFSAWLDGAGLRGHPRANAKKW